MSDTIYLVMLAFLAVGGYLLTVVKAAVKTSAEEAAKAAVRELQWPAELARDLQKTRGVERQEHRFRSYSALWKELRSLAIYDADPITRETVARLSKSLSDWYFSEDGGLVLTPQARDFYFALQDLLWITSHLPEDWTAVKSDETEGSHRERFLGVLQSHASETVDVLERLSEPKLGSWQEEGSEIGKVWRAGIRRVASAWSNLDERQRFASLQQVGSKLRTALVADLESRLP